MCSLALISGGLARTLYLEEDCILFLHVFFILERERDETILI